ncbi:esterase-like activity of phytase family protein [Labrenzia sp. R4_2]|uniref:esterase-like activity of phytase family protein n=1 Tax=Labrenzia sp. R4_2 TaxID=2821107 RepID=UPI001ADB5D0A|nr:esterase-like activity of phytase family protein [Labrenzia sp. R4_2]MBO9421499.1 esterase-like activity of phytase family protein [Labrenzia sp. R4_2]
MSAFFSKIVGTAAAGLAAAVLSFSAPVSAEGLLDEAKQVRVKTRPIETFHIGHSNTEFGKLTFLGGFEILASDRKTGGLSGVISLDDGNRLLAVTDNGHWVAATVEQTDEGAPTGLSDLRYAVLLGADGKSLRARWGHDTEALTLDATGLYVSAERNHAVYHYEWPLLTGDERMLGQLALPKALDRLPGNTGIEALAAGPAGGDLDGKLIAISETTPSDEHDFLGFVLGPDGAEEFSIKRHDRFDVTDAAFLPDGDLLLMERRFNMKDLIGLRLRRLSGSDLKAGAVLDGEILLEADFNYQIDNMEALAVHQNAAGDTILTLLSDNNRSLLQRTLLLRFRLNEQ